MKPMAVLYDFDRCMGCRACQVICKMWNQNPAGPPASFFQGPGYQNPGSLNDHTFSVVRYNELVDPKTGELRYYFGRKQCMACLKPACASACIVGALEKLDYGPVIWHPEKCMGCRYCMVACPFGVPTFEWHSNNPRIRKCTFCYNRQGSKYEEVGVKFEGYSDEQKKQLEEDGRLMLSPACVTACPSDSMIYGTREAMLEEAYARIEANPDAYPKHPRTGKPWVYGEHEVGGTSWLLLSTVPYDKLGFPILPFEPADHYTKISMISVPITFTTVVIAMAGSYYLTKRREEVKASEGKTSKEKESKESEEKKGGES